MCFNAIIHGRSFAIIEGLTQKYIYYSLVMIRDYNLGKQKRVSNEKIQTTGAIPIPTFLYHV